MDDTNKKKSTKLSYTLFPKDWDAKQIYEHLMARYETTLMAKEEQSDDIETDPSSESNS